MGTAHKMGRNDKTTTSKKIDEAVHSRQGNNTRSKTPLIFAGAVFLILILIGVYAFTASNNDESDSSPTTSETSPSGTPTQQDRSVSGKSLEQDKKDALKASTSILNEGTVGANENYQQPLQRLEQGDTSDVSKKLTNQLHLTGAFESDDEIKVTVYQSLITLSAVIGGSEGNEIKPASNDVWQNVQVDQEAGIAYVPLSVYANRDVPFSFEMVYIDGEWKLAPYTLLEAIKMSSMMNQQGGGASPTPNG